ncbi:MAG: DUF805 domain-containing protein [Halieaceae bacterium]|nr:DUF805 domain-containing protein [Halieaceae bacterium]
MDFSSAVQSFFNKYATFQGRASRSEFWYAQLFIILTGFFLGFIEGLLGISPFSEVSVLASIFQLGVFMPSIAIIARRFHDINKSGWWYFLILTIVGVIPVFYWFCKKGNDYENDYGANPLDFDVISEKPSSETLSSRDEGND